MPAKRKTIAPCTDDGDHSTSAAQAVPRAFTRSAWARTIGWLPGDDFPCHPQSVQAQQWNRMLAKRALNRVRPHAARLSRNELREFDEILYLKAGVQPWDPDAMLEHFRQIKGEAGRWCVLHHLIKYRVLRRRHLPVLCRALQDPASSVRGMVLSAIIGLEGARAEPLVLAELEGGHRGDAYRLMAYFREHGTRRAVPAVAAWVTRAVARRRRTESSETDLVLACEFLETQVDIDRRALSALADVVRKWPNVASEEADCLQTRVRWVGRRVIDILRPAARRDERVSLQGPLGTRRLFKADEEQA